MSLQTKSPEAEAVADWVESLKCPDCGLPYNESGAVISMSPDDWEKVYPEGKGQPGCLCGTCICRRVDKLEGQHGIKVRLV